MTKVKDKRDRLIVIMESRLLEQRLRTLHLLVEVKELLVLHLKLLLVEKVELLKR